MYTYYMYLIANNTFDRVAASRTCAHVHRAESCGTIIGEICLEEPEQLYFGGATDGRHFAEKLLLLVKSVWENYNLWVIVWNVLRW